jgi:hypothetical protein
MTTYRIIQNARHTLSKNYYLAQAGLQFLKLNLQQQQPIIVYQMGRVGSTTIFQSLKKAFSALKLKQPIYHTHFLTPEGIAFFEEIQKSTYGSWEQIPLARKRYILQSYFLSKQLTNNRAPKKKYKIITLVREPIATNISGFFHNCDLWLNDLQNYQNNSQSYLDKIRERFYQEYPHNVPLTWFDRELKSILDLDVFASEFPKKEGYKIYEGEFFQLLLLKLESLNFCAKQAFKKFLGLEDFILIKSHTANEKKYSNIYGDFMNSMSISEEYLDKMYNSKYTQHFYSPEEIETFKEKWSQK